MKEAERARPPEREPTSERELEVSLHRCPFCRDAIALDEEAWVVCSACLARHHRGCWDEHGACSACAAESFLVDQREAPRAPADLDQGLFPDDEVRPQPIPRTTYARVRLPLRLWVLVAAIGAVLAALVIWLGASRPDAMTPEREVLIEQSLFRTFAARIKACRSQARRAVEEGEVARALELYRDALELSQQNLTRYPTGVPSAAELDAWLAQLDALLQGPPSPTWQRDAELVMTQYWQRLAELNPGFF